MKLTIEITPNDLAQVEQRISRRIMLYAGQRAPHIINQFSIEDIVREEMVKTKTQIEITPEQSRILSTLAPDGKLETALQVLVAIAEQGVSRPGSHEAETVRQIFGEDWREKLRKSA